MAEETEHVQSVGKSISELQWAHHTLMRLIETVQLNGLVTEGLGECLVMMTKSAVLLEGLIHQNMFYARRRRED